METQLHPTSPAEERLWRLLEKADKPIVTTLKRINRILSRQFGESIQTEDSCSGHIFPDGALYFEEDTFPDKIIREYYPSLIFRTLSEKREHFLEFLRPILKPAVDAVNKKYGQNVLGFDEWNPKDPTHGIESDVYSIGFSFPILAKKNSAYEILVDLWTHIDLQLSVIDHLKLNNQYTPSLFFHN